MKKIKILEKSEFADLIYYERERSERTNRPFSLIHVDFTKIDKKTNAKAFKEIIITIEPFLRTIDRIGWIKNNTICILLPETKIDGAKYVAVKIKNKLIERVGEKSYLPDFVVSTYPKIPDFNF